MRTGQNISTQALDANVKVYAPVWVKAALQKLVPIFKGKIFQIGEIDQSITIKDEMSLTQLIAIARNEQVNCSGVIKRELYDEDITLESIIALRDLAKHCVIVGKDFATHTGGFGSSLTTLTPKQEVYICDLSGLQFQQQYNNGRHVLIARDELPKGALDDEIYQGTVGKDKPTYDEAREDISGRFVEGKFHDKAVFFDTKVYHDFITQDFVLAAISLNEQARIANDDINFKFLAYGVGFFASGLGGAARDRLRENLVKGVLKGLEQLLAMPQSYRSQIKRLELPFYIYDARSEQVNQELLKVKKLCEENGIAFSSDNKDALTKTSTLITATTNCSDPHAPCGNEMHRCSVDAAIAENIESRGNKFSPICNPQMQSSYVTLPFIKPTYQYDSSQIVFNLSTAVGELIKQLPHHENNDFKPTAKWLDNGELQLNFRGADKKGWKSATSAAMEFIDRLKLSGFSANRSRWVISFHGKDFVDFARFCAIPEDQIKQMYIDKEIKDYEKFFQPSPNQTKPLVMTPFSSSKAETSTAQTSTSTAKILVSGAIVSVLGALTAEITNQNPLIGAAAGLVTGMVGGYFVSNRCIRKSKPVDTADANRLEKKKDLRLL